jgi:hypothetical protein
MCSFHALSLALLFTNVRALFLFLFASVDYSTVVVVVYLVFTISSYLAAMVCNFAVKLHPLFLPLTE